ncbi:flagella assembly protein FlgT middle domain-containing protein [Cellvibrio mixtus]|uniref:flagella assembly protein FlgT middle domain-containing protein n=1 Tax=Cellvibrio mixtus TaxID=39650 RepID=UPI000586D280|nr:flagella assembly protein FlgT middle domain-containing protein [Cellvibrio mixtus]
MGSYKLPLKTTIDCLAAKARPGRLLLTLLVAFSSSLVCVNSSAGPSIVPDDIAYKPKTAPAETNMGDVIVGTADLPGNPSSSTATTQPAQPPTTQTTEYMGNNLCPDHSGAHINLQKSLTITRFLRATPYSANAGNLFAAESEIPALIRTQLNENFQSISPNVLAFGFADAGSNETQLKQQAQKIARQARTQFVLSGTIDDMSMSAPNATYNPNLYRQAANLFHDVTTIKKFDKRTRILNLSVQLRDGFTGELLFNKQFSTSGIWNTREPIGFDSPAFYKTHYGKQIKSLTEKISKDVAQVVHCQPFMASIDSQPGQAQIVLHGGANNGLHAGDTLSLYQVVVVGSNTEYQVNETRLVKRDTRLHLSEVYPSHSVAQVEGGSYLNGHYLAVGE